MRVLLYKTHSPKIEAGQKIILRNTISERELELSFEAEEFHNSYILTVESADLSKLLGGCTLTVTDAEGATIYTEQATVQ
ncbi:hypothetical protein [Rufibacter ruber]|uniref:hypothetical protein n=1 Tax=Rufibacter ruber TaxID=1783499 RepID=UPI000AD67B70|nr:hypothetical protein [Rufibacter ruber]